MSPWFAGTPAGGPTSVLDLLALGSGLWEALLRLAGEEAEAPALAFLEARLIEIKVARREFRAVKSGTLTAGDVDLF